MNLEQTIKAIRRGDEVEIEYRLAPRERPRRLRFRAEDYEYYTTTYETDDSELEIDYETCEIRWIVKGKKVTSAYIAKKILRTENERDIIAMYLTMKYWRLSPSVVKRVASQKKPKKVTIEEKKSERDRLRDGKTKRGGARVVREKEVNEERREAAKKKMEAIVGLSAKYCTYQYYEMYREAYIEYMKANGVVVRKDKEVIGEYQKAVKYLQSQNKGL